MSKFEKLLDFLVNEEMDKANELFHEIVVERSREIYENLISDEETTESFIDEFASNDEVGDDDMFPVQDKTDDFDDDVEDEFDDEDEDEFGDDEFGDDEFGDDEFGDEDGDSPATKDDIHDLESALDELKAEFEKLMAGEEAEEEEHPGIHGDDDGDDYDFGDEESDDEESDDEESDDEESDDEESKMPFGSRKSQGETMREYIERVTATMDGGLVGGRTGETMSAPKEGKSPVSSGSGKPTSGANAKNIAQDCKGADEDGTSPKGKVGGLVKKGGDFPHAGNFENSQSKNRSTKNIWGQAKKPGNKEGAGVGAVAGGDKAGQTGGVITKSPLTGAPNRAK
jgi:hypothetical protein